MDDANRRQHDLSSLGVDVSYPCAWRSYLVVQHPEVASHGGCDQKYLRDGNTSVTTLMNKIHVQMTPIDHDGSASLIGIICAGLGMANLPVLILGCTVESAR